MATSAAAAFATAAAAAAAAIAARASFAASVVALVTSCPWAIAAHMARAIAIEANTIVATGALRRDMPVAAALEALLDLLRLNLQSSALELAPIELKSLCCVLFVVVADEREPAVAAFADEDVDHLACAGEEVF